MIKKMRPLLLFISTLIFIYSAAMLTSHFYNLYKNNRNYKKLKNIYNIEQNFNSQEDSPNLDDLRKEKFNKLQEINKDIIGWIYIPNTKIDYPVVKASDNEFYLNRDVEKKTNKAGAIFMDYRNSLDENFNTKDKNTVLYGHHMKDGSMFADLKKFKSEDFFNENRYIYLDTKEGRKKYEIFSVFITKTDFNYIKSQFNNEKDFTDFSKSIQEKSSISTDIKLSNNDEFLTLSTCTYEFDDGRLALVGRLVK